jgi:HEAT repeat protein
MARINAQTAAVLPLRLASIAAIGQVGTTEDRELLESLLAGTDNSVHKAATVALKKLGQR